MEEKLLIDFRGLEKFSLIEWPGKISAILFTGGCNFRCPFCHNPELVNIAETQNFVSGHETPPPFPWSEIEKFLDKKKGWIDAVMITGGEPTLHKDLPKVLEIIKSKGYLVGLETNGTNPEMLRNIIKNNTLDRICMDIKSSPQKYSLVSGGKNLDFKKIKESIGLLKSSGIIYEFRTTVSPEIVDKSDIEEIGELIKGAKFFALQQFRPIKTLDLSYKDKRPLPKQEIEEMAKIMEKYVEKVDLEFIE